MNIIPKNNRIGKFLGKRNNNSFVDFDRVNTTKYDIVVHPSVLELQIVNVTASNKGFYWFDTRYPSVHTYPFGLQITSMFIVLCMVVI